MEFITFNHFKKAVTCQPYFIWHDFQLEEDTNFEDINQIWSTDILDSSANIQMVMAKVYSLLEKAILKEIKNQYASIIFLSGDHKKRIIDTRKYHGTKNLVVGAVFELDGVIAKPFAFDFENNQIIEINYSAKTKRINFLKAWYQYKIIRENVSVNNYYLYLPENAYLKKNQVNIISVTHFDSSKQGSYPKERKKSGELKASWVMDSLRNGQVARKISFPNFEKTIKLVKDSQNAKINKQLLKHDSTDWGDNPYWKELLLFLDHPMAGYSGNILRKKNIIKDDNHPKKLYYVLNKLNKSKIQDFKFVEQFINEIDEQKNLAWFDFEGFSLPYAAVDYTKPYSQQVFQVSVIVTVAGKEKEVINKIWDPQKLKPKHFIEIIETVYQNKKDAYIVYNKAYELSRMKEALFTIATSLPYQDVDYVKDMIDHIENNIIDLMELFKWSGNKLPSIILNDQKGFFSIKNVEKHINDNQLPINYKIPKYSSLKVQNGLMAMNLAIERSLGIIGDHKWKEITNNLKKYCENDVRAMIMVYFFVKYLLHQNKK